LEHALSMHLCKHGTCVALHDTMLFLFSTVSLGDIVGAAPAESEEQGEMGLSDCSVEAVDSVLGQQFLSF